MAQGYIYILTNPSFPDYVKIGYADDVNKRLRQLNHSECTPFAFRVYATYEVDARLTDMKIHEVIDILNPNLRSIDTVNGKKRVREFYAISAEDAYKLLEAIAQINGLEANLRKNEKTEEDTRQEQEAEEVAAESAERRSPFRFSMIGIKPGEKVASLERPEIVCTVVDDRHIEYDGNVMSMSALAKDILGRVHMPAGPRHFTYNGRALDDIRAEREGL